MAGSNGKQKSVRNMVLSLGVTILAAGVIYVFVPHDESEPDIKRVDYRVELLTARRAASYPVAAPEGLAEEWKATSVRFRGDESDSWHLGYQAPNGEYVQVRQSAASKKVPFIDEATQGARETKATQEIAGRTWTRYTGGRYDALVLKEDGATTVVAGTGSFEQLAQMVRALKTQ
ncbi:DUF4245 domain-containing protein [Streptomyces sp. TRM68416]|uniref:DUF4245 domain-containing protein n=1 Tax=Streptomyces sp. TRM68416 TaxID=2758412 RepID=UPI001661A32B|nr:DUF4245 domain-containing protein [Streptomyces sp. TRM68416]MBD0843055.1 DUF4245 domain-containing protein [Streptomyces sp. TRM68416]